MPAENQALLELLLCSRKLSLALKKRPDLINQQNKDGNTLLHLAVCNPHHMNNDKIITQLKILLEQKELNLTLKNSMKNTPVHQAIMECNNETSCFSILPLIIEAANEKQFDFSTPGYQGKTALHLAAMINFRHQTKATNHVALLLKTTAKLSLNCLSSSGSSALFYAIAKTNYQEANALLDAGINPLLCGHSRRAPLTEIELILALLNQEIKKPQLRQYHTTFQRHITQITALQEKIYKIIGRQEIIKNTIIIAQGVRGMTLFSKLPTHLQIDIAAKTQKDGTCTKREARDIAAENHARFIERKFA
jgi:hypothetical protein